MPLAEALREAALEAFDRYPLPNVLDEASWTKARVELGRRVVGIGLHPPKAVKDIPFAVAPQIFGNLPIHASIRGDDQEIVINHLRLTLIGIYDDFVERADVAALTRDIGVDKGADQLSATGR